MGLELRRVVTEARLGRPLEEALDGVAERMASPDFAWAVMAIRIQREVGGNLSELLLTVAETMIQRERLRRDVAALTAEGRMSAYILIALPIGLGAVMFVMNKDYTSKLLTTRYRQHPPGRSPSCRWSSATCGCGRSSTSGSDRGHVVMELVIGGVLLAARPRAHHLRRPHPGRRQGDGPQLTPPARGLRGRERPRPGAPRPALRAGRRAGHVRPHRRSGGASRPPATSTTSAASSCGPGVGNADGVDRFLAVRTLTAAAVLPVFVVMFIWNPLHFDGHGQAHRHRPR